MRLKSILLFLSLILAGTFRANSQLKYTINFDTTGRLRSTLPERIYKDDKLYFLVNEPGETFDQYQTQITKKLEKAVEHLDSIRANQSDKELLDVIYDIKDADILALSKELKAALANPFTGAALKFVPVFKIVDKDYYNLQPIHTVAPGPISFGPNAPSSELEAKLKDGEKELDFRLSKTDPFKKLRYNWLTATASDYTAHPDFSELPSKLPELRQKVTAVSNCLKWEDFMRAVNIADKAIKTNTSFSRSDSILVRRVLDSAHVVSISLDNYLDRIQPLLHVSDKNWILKWFWYQDNKIPVLNPFPFRKEAEFGREPDTSELGGLRQKIAIRDQFFKAAKVESMNMRSIDSLIDASDSLKKRQDSIQKASRSYADKVARNDKNQLAFGTTGSLLNNGIFLVGNADSVFWLRHHDATQNYQLMNDLDSREYPEDDRVIILAHNLKVGERVDLHLSFQDITNDESVLSSTIRGVLKELSPASKILEAGAFSLDASGLNTSTRVLIEGLQNEVERMKTALERARTYTRAINYLIAQTDPITKIDEVTDKSVAYHSEVANPVRKVDGPKKATYYMNTVSTQAAANTGSAASPVVADTFHYRINKLYRIFPMAGITYRTTRFNKVTRDPGSTVDKNVREPALQFIVGAKVYLRKTDIHDPKIFWMKDKAGRRLLLSRTSINIAVEAKDPLANVFTGLGLDIWPGFCINAGAAFNRYQYNVYTNGELGRSDYLYRTGFYVGLSTDINLFTDLARFLNLTK
jgi:hypothetical protein